MAVEISSYLLGISQNALVGALTVWGQARDDNRVRAEHDLQIERESLKPLLDRIEQKLVTTFAALESNREVAQIVLTEMGDPIFLRLLSNQISLCRNEPEILFNKWVSDRPEIEEQRSTLTPFITRYLDIVFSAIASDAELSRRMQMSMLGRIDRRMDSALMPPEGVAATPAFIPSSEDLQQACVNVSQALLAWPTGIDGERIESPAFAQLVEPLLPEQSNVHLLLGEPGSGKSALLAHSAHWFLERGWLVLAIKADLLPQGIDNVAKLGLHLGIGELPSQALKQLARRAQIVVLVDQLDSLADLVDLHGGRLNALLQLIRDLSGIENLRVIASSREVEHRHDARLASIAAEAIILPLPEWPEVNALLEKRGVAAGDWPEAFREILRRPQQLAVFVKLLNSGQEMPIFTSYQQMLERLWGQCVTNSGGLVGRADLLRDLARQMATEESLWLARARFDDRAPQVEQLIASGILTTAEDERRLGFQHQTVFDFTLARSFAVEGQALTDFVLARQQSLFVRPRLWSALVYLRGAEPHTYRREFAALWLREDLRYHVRLQLVEFLGQLEDPDDREEEFFREAFSNPVLRLTALVAIVGRRSWFERLVPDVLPQLMEEGKKFGGLLCGVLSAAAKMHSDMVLNLLRDHWISRPEVDLWTASVLTNIQPWNWDATRLGKTLAGRESTGDMRLFDVICFAAETDAAMAVSILGAFVQRKANEIQCLSDSYETTDDYSIYSWVFNRSPRRDAAKGFLAGNANWPDLKAIAESAPEAIIGQVWPSFIRLLFAMHENEEETEVAFRSEYIGRSMSEGAAPLIEAMEVATEALARKEGAAFTDFLRDAGDLNSMTVQKIFARSLASNAALKPEIAFDFLLGDPRRFRIGDHYGSKRESGLLISSLCPHLATEQIQKLEDAITCIEVFRSYRPDIESEDIKRLTRQERLRLLRYIPASFRSPGVTALIGAEEAAFPEIEQEEGIRIGEASFVGSPLTTDEMADVSDEALFATLSELPDETEWQNPKDPSQGGSIQVSRAFAELAKRQPERAILLTARLDPSEHTRPVAYAIERIAESELPSDQLFGFVRALIARGFKSVEFRGNVADALLKRVKKNEALPDDLFELFERWLPEIADETSHVENQIDSSEEDSKSTLLWQSMHSWMVPNGTYRIICLLDAACHVAKAPEKFLAIVHNHLTSPERVSTWRCICWHLDLLEFADSRESALFMSELFRRFPDVRDSLAGVRAIAHAFRWLPQDSVVSLLQSINTSEWSSRERAYGELLMYRHAFWGDEWAAANIDQILGDPNSSEDLLTGIATTSIHAFLSSAGKAKATVVLLELIPRAGCSTAAEVLSLFSFLPQLDLGSELIGILNTLLENPCALVPDALGSLVQRLPDLIPTRSVLAAALANSILDHQSDALFDMSKSFAASTDDLVNLALTLHRDEGSGRELGLDLFERLLLLNVDGTRQSLLAVDSRPVAGASTRYRRPLRRTTRRR